MPDVKGGGSVGVVNGWENREKTSKQCLFDGVLEGTRAAETSSRRMFTQ